QRTEISTIGTPFMRRVHGVAFLRRLFDNIIKMCNLSRGKTVSVSLSEAFAMDCTMWCRFQSYSQGQKIPNVQRIAQFGILSLQLHQYSRQGIIRARSEASI